MPRLNVRCCCQPQKILGTLELSSYSKTQYLHFPTRIPIPKIGEAKEETIKYHTIELKTIVDCATGKEELAVYSDDRPIEFWRQFKGFIETPT